MEIIAKQSYVRGSVQKLTEVSRVIKHMKVTAMRTQLSQMNKDAARRILETLNQAVANAQHNYGISEDKLMLKELLILRGPHYKRMRPVSRGQGHAILKRTSHISITLSSIEPKVEKAVEEKVEQKSESTTETKKTVTKKPTVKKVVKAKTE
ncbi:MAG: uL22 family ribosomal protein [Candidatus Woesebacteria bacterium]